MNSIIKKLRSCPQISDWKINVHRKESYELFFVKGKLETLRRTDTCDKLVTVYAAHGEFLGDSMFYVYPSTTSEQLDTLIGEAAEKALLICNKPYTLPADETGDYLVESNFEDIPVDVMAAEIANAVFDANTVENGTLNSVEIFLNRHTETVRNSRGIHKTQIRYDAMLETIPTYTAQGHSVELYHQYSFSTLDPASISGEIRNKMKEVKARSEAVTPGRAISCPVIFNIQDLTELFAPITHELTYNRVYSHSNQYSKGDKLQPVIEGDPIGITMCGQMKGSPRSRAFDGDGISLGSVRLVENGVITGYFGSNQFGQYLNEKPTGKLRCISLDPGSWDCMEEDSLEIVSMSCLQVDISNDYIGGEIRLAYLRENGKTTPVTGISISGSLSRVLSDIHLSKETSVLDGYSGPVKAKSSQFSIF